MDKEAAVAQVKQLQRSDNTAKLQWGEYCDRYLAGVRDPQAHDPSVLMDFVAQYNSGALPPPDPTANIKGAGKSSGNPLVDQVKNLQRNDPTAKLQWGEYCDTYLGGKRDPLAHDNSVLENFIQSYNTGVLPKPNPAAAAAQAYNKGCGKGGIVQGQMWGAGGPQQWGAAPQQWGAGGPASGPVAGPAGGGDFVKYGQRQSQAWKAAWQAYCSNYGAGKFDPNTHSPEFINQFIEYAGGLMVADMGANPNPVMLGTKRNAEAAAWGGPPEKKVNMGVGPGAMVGMGMGAGMGAPGGVVMGGAPGMGMGMPMAGAGDPEKMALVNKVREYQRSCPEAKEAWGQYCDSWLGGTRDPNRHDNDTLRTFIETHCP